jgi:hypothetical protein
MSLGDFSFSFFYSFFFFHIFCNLKLLDCSTLNLRGDVREYILHIIVVIGFGRRIYDMNLIVIRFDSKLPYLYTTTYK